MAQTRRRWLAALAASASLAGCIGDGDSDGGSESDGGGKVYGTTTGSGDDGSDGDTADDENTSEDGGTGRAAASIQTSDHEQLGEILVDGDGTTLYMFEPDPQGEGSSTCSGDCAAAWPPLTTETNPESGDGVTASLATFERSDGSTQVAANGWPLYYFAQDSEPGDVAGQGIDGFGGYWWVLRPDGTPVRPDVQIREHSDLGNILVDGEGMTLYMFDSDSQGSGSSACSGGCADAWPPLTVEEEPMAGTDLDAELTTFDRSGGSTQVAANGWPLYNYAQDSEPGDATGQGVQDGWWVLDPSGAPIRDIGGSSEGDFGGSSDDETGY
ncbi:hypothetical protein [Salinarchaeum sp. Harcht-Bsk1]|uniref:hypothetical protein n=1 Tax=Salinarchaeum sp. Harcht-Bsk1 TaxID=1333523 RepID=UPI000677C499|nr:hypothetical protein [Salinarchaeum sp. Harcht-Bsk1]